MSVGCQSGLAEKMHHSAQKISQKNTQTCGAHDACHRYYFCTPPLFRWELRPCL